MNKKKLASILFAASLISVSSSYVFANELPVNSEVKQVETAITKEKNVEAETNSKDKNIEGEKNSTSSTNTVTSSEATVKPVSTVKPIESNSKTENTTDSNKPIVETNFITKAVAKQLNKDVQALTLEDFKTIKALDLSNQNLDGTIPDTIGKLTNLTSLKLNDNKLIGAVPEAILNLKALSYIDLSNNKLTLLPEGMINKLKDKTFNYINIDNTSIKLTKGMYFLKGNYYFINEDGQAIGGWQLLSNKYYYFDKNGIRLTGWQKVDNSWYLLGADGVMKTGFQKVDGHEYYLNPNGDMATGWKLLDNKWYFFRVSGEKATGWNKHNDLWSLFDANGVMLTGWQKTNNVLYYIDDNGYMATGWRSFNNKWCFFKDNGEKATGWNKSNNLWSLFDSNGIMLTGWQKVNNIYYYIDNNGYMVTGWKNIDSKHYYLNADGSMATGWKTIGSETFYLNPNGDRVNPGFNKIGGKTYYFYSNSVLARDTWIGNQFIGPDGVVRPITVNDTNSQAQFNLFNYMINPSNEESVHQRAISLHGGVTSNNCVYFTSEALRRIGFSLPNQTCNTGQLEVQLNRIGFTKSYNLDALKPGDIVFAGSAHVYIFMGWSDNSHEYAYIVDNQKGEFGTTLHKRKIKAYDPIKDTFKATHFYHL